MDGCGEDTASQSAEKLSDARRFYLKMTVWTHATNLRDATLGSRPDPHLRKDIAGRAGAGTNAVWDADAVITVACQRQAGEILAEGFDALQAFEVADRIL